MTYEEQKKNSAKPLLWISMVSMSLFFAGLSSGYIVAKSDVWPFYEVPIWFYISTIVIIASSFTMHKSKKLIQNDQQSEAVSWINKIIASSFTMHEAKKLIKNDQQLEAVRWIKYTLALGLSFVISQFLVWSSLVKQGFYFTPPNSSDFYHSSGFLYAFTAAHLLHLLAGIIVLLVCWYKASNLKYSNGNSLGFELASIFWHFLDILWVYLFLFLLLIR